ncbi:MAG: thiamine phosphate synthase [Methylohalobius sp.]|nr:thiamine phosphate synthase [Methylohalobius sp.]
MLYPFPRSGLYVITPENQSLVRLMATVEAALRGGAQVIQLRAKHRRPDLAEAKALLDLCHAYRVPLIVNDDLKLAEHLGADGVHLGRDDPDPALARSCLGASAIIGVSCYADLERAIWAEETGASYVAFGAFFPSPTKPHAALAPIELLASAKLRLSCPIVAIGGITPENGAELLRAGADLLAAIDGVFAGSDPCQAASRYARLFA